MSETLTPDRLLHQALARGRLPHGLLFAGPEGVGKRAVAVRLAQALLCARGGAEACGTCAPCGKVDRGTHPDLHFLTPQGTVIKIGEDYDEANTVRHLIRLAAYKSFEGRAKVFIIEDAHQLNLPSANALLKTLEEPPSDAYLILLTSQPQALLPTIRSRTQRVAFRALSAAAVRDALIGDDAMDPAEAEFRARYCGGSLATARNLDPAALHETIEEAVQLVELATGARAGSGEVRALFDAAKTASIKQELTDALLVALKGIVRDVAVVGRTGSSAAVLNRDWSQRIEAIAGRLPAEHALDTLARIEQGEADFQHHANKRLVLDSLLLGLWRAGAA